MCTVFNVIYWRFLYLDDAACIRIVEPYVILALGSDIIACFLCLVFGAREISMDSIR